MAKWTYIGQMRSQMAIEKATETTDATGAVVQTWSEIGLVWAYIRPLSGRELSDARQVEADVTHEVRMRYRSDLTARMRLTFRGRTLEILGLVNIDELDRELILTCVEVT